MKSPETSPEEFKKDIARVARRTFISKELENTKSISEVSEGVRQRETQSDVQGIIEKLTESGETLEPKIEKLCESLLEKLRAEFPFIKGIVVMGSGAHGGGLVRSIVGDEEEDLDWTIVSSKRLMSQSSIDQEVLKEIRIRGDEIMREIAPQVGFTSEIQSCPMYNPRSGVIYELDKNEAELLVMKDAYSIRPYLNPTIPKTVGENNRILIQRALLGLETNDNWRFGYLGRDLKDMWKKMHTLKYKHFEHYNKDSRSVTMLKRIEDNSAKSMTDKPVRGLIDTQERTRPGE
ncbi:hypothetical protein A3K34_02400 [candidate division WWE3 bacterium RIFOXYC1_FULL_40_10]|uniref:Uncharacterized protein n=1 Tax=candidate division WWE3 bacterium RIFOXYA2_FULL_46_9 TaxID=1802636 RepID=A0A1F4VZT7_UNCKA|nr:MAG: hypothetical protein A3K58_02400 [candidate division WWE3 bacterium RIFOXYB1_FULL_40_22]OGC61702.1 MAG: hypothetical protein A3K37_02400 [candidate division WWE3 bacterium RIFOXYA1_FULL_40_11]OGC62313.1 MAG: hypothetical protein A2264_01970 [candidate division WWE3 bacterium RIFOXYA2_FULL_46_9]OGC64876.1 MAG: hypothetical protein A2326_01225 [candidate division WWE3 bacterium RIFOXYB2_FULL_41_6]OGC66085.1 MAG: hypothetical protein A3K34_02400 [candidate division WWE3 bacterium RIFOXYC1_